MPDGRKLLRVSMRNQCLPSFNGGKPTGIVPYADELIGTAPKTNYCRFLDGQSSE
jgi:hypothetical protein